ncbi:MAG TPA: hypothetical protein VE714_12960 [Gemmatimonadales bacterium]|nr:hypothetical protein [Gemmatimonadales bacterium]
MMGKINLQKVLIGGLIAGVVLNVVDFVVFNMVLKDQMTAALTALGKAPPGGGQIVPFVVLDFAAGVFFVWLYAAIRPRFGAGPVTAAKAGVAAWCIGSLLVNAFMAAMAIMPQNLLLMTTVITLVEWPLAVVIGAKFYTEGAAVGAGMGVGT